MSSDTPRSALVDALVSAQHCDCGNRGWYVVTGRGGEPEQQQCEFCYTTPNSMFNVVEKVKAYLSASSETKDNALDPTSTRRVAEQGQPAIGAPSAIAPKHLGSWPNWEAFNRGDAPSDKSHQTSSKREITAMAAEEWDKRGPSFLRFYEGAPELTKIRLAHEEGFIAGLCASSAIEPMPWRHEALALLGFKRDSMPAEHVKVVQDFLSTSAATDGEAAK